jgi:DNA-binding CsgD family transcriptional regulator
MENNGQIFWFDEHLINCKTCDRMKKPTKKETADQLRLRLRLAGAGLKAFRSGSLAAILRVMKEWRKDHPLEKDSEIATEGELIRRSDGALVAERAKVDVKKWRASEPEDFIHATGIDILVDRAGYPVRIHKTRRGWEYPDFDRIGMHPLDWDTSLLEHEPAPWPVPGTGWNAATDPTAKKEPGKAPKHRTTRYIEDRDTELPDDHPLADTYDKPRNVEGEREARTEQPMDVSAPDLQPELRSLTPDEAEVLRLKALGWTHARIAAQINISLRKVDDLVRTLKDLNIISQESSESL